jgi:hypothetical protein
MQVTMAGTETLLQPLVEPQALLPASAGFERVPDWELRESLAATSLHGVKFRHACCHCSDQFSLVELEALSFQVVVQCRSVAGPLDRGSELLVFLHS